MAEPQEQTLGDVLEFYREQTPSLAAVPDETLVSFIGDTYPDMVTVPAFGRAYFGQRIKPVVQADPDVFERSAATATTAMPALEAWQQASAEQMTLTPEEAKARVQERIQVGRDIESRYGYMVELSGDHPQKMAAAKQFRTAAYKQAGFGVVEEPDLTQPIWDLPVLDKRTVMDALGVNETTAEVVAGLQRGIVGAAEFWISPFGTLTLGTGALPVATQRAVAASFAVHMSSQMPELTLALGRAMKAGDTETATELATAGVLNAWFIGKATKHALGIKPKARSMAEEAGRYFQRVMKVPEVGEALKRMAGNEALAAFDPLRAQWRVVEGLKPGTFEHSLTQAVRTKGGLTPAGEELTLRPTGETITGPDEGKASVIPAEPTVSVTPPQGTVGAVGPQLNVDLLKGGETGAKEAKAKEEGQAVVKPPSSGAGANQVRPPNLIDFIRDNIGHIRSKRGAKPGTEGYYTEAYKQAIRRGAVRKLFSSKRGESPDEVVDDLRRAGQVGEDFTVDDLWDEFLRLADTMKAERAGASQENKLYDQLAAQRLDFEHFALENKRQPEAKAKSGGVPVDELFVGDHLAIDEVKFTVRDITTDPETGEVGQVVLEDGRRFGIQTVSGEQVIYPDEGKIDVAQRVIDPEFLPPEEISKEPKATAPATESTPVAPPPAPATVVAPEQRSAWNARLNELEDLRSLGPLTPRLEAERLQLQEQLGQMTLIDAKASRTVEEIEADHERLAQEQATSRAERELAEGAAKRLLAGQLEVQRRWMPEPGQQDMFGMPLADPVEPGQPGRGGVSRSISQAAQEQVAQRGPAPSPLGETHGPGELQLIITELALDLGRYLATVPRRAGGSIDWRALTSEQVDGIFDREFSRLDAVTAWLSSLRQSKIQYPSHEAFLQTVRLHDRWWTREQLELRGEVAEFQGDLVDFGGVRTLLPGQALGMPTGAAGLAPAPAAGPALVQLGRNLKGTIDPTVKGTVTLPQVLEQMQALIHSSGATAPIRQGRFFQKAHGIYKPEAEVIRVDRLDNLPTGIHEIGHALQAQLYGTAYAHGLRGLPPAVKRELIALGRALYGPKEPSAGYTSEGFAEFMRYELTTEDAARVAPKTHQFWTKDVLPRYPELAAAWGKTRTAIDTWRFQGAENRARVQMVKEPVGWRKLAADTAEYIHASQWILDWVDEFEPLREMSARAARKANVAGLPPSQDPFLLATWKRGTAGNVVRTMVELGMQDIWGNPTFVGRALRDILAPLKGQQDEFALYLWARRAIELHKRRINPGLALVDALELLNKYSSPAFERAASEYYEWNRGLLRYVAQSNPALEPLIAAILKKNKNYAPLARVIDPKQASSAAAAERSNPLYKIHGSPRPVRDIGEVTIENAARLVSMAHRHLVLQAVVNMSKWSGMGHLVERVPRSSLEHRVNVGRVRQQLEDLGVDTSAIQDTEVLTWFEPALKPKGEDPIIAVREANGVNWYHVKPRVYDLLNGLDPVRLQWALDLILGKPARAFRLGTTGLRPSFGLWTNVARDLGSFLAQTTSHAHPEQLLGSYLMSLKEVGTAALTGRQSHFTTAYRRLGVEAAQPLGYDRADIRRAVKGLYRGKFFRVVSSPIEHLRDLLSVTESVPRVAELRLIAKEIGWQPGTLMTPDQAVQMGVSPKRVTVDFSAHGRLGKIVNQAVPFFNPSIQGTRSFARAFRENPSRAIWTGAVAFTLPALANWWRNKDEDWYTSLPWRERYLYTNVADGSGNVWQIPRAFEWGNAFQVIPEALVDGAYRRDPAPVVAALRHLFETMNPADLPVLARIALEQKGNRVAFFDRPIVPRAEVDLQPGEQRGHYTSKLAQWIGDAFPTIASPRKIDHAIRGYFGGTAPDLLDALGLGARKAERDWERSDFPVFGRAFRRGGEFSAASQHIADFYDEWTGLAVRKRGTMRPLTTSEEDYFMLLDASQQYLIAPALELARTTRESAARRDLYADASHEARRLLTLKPKEERGR